jgi:putative ferrous iron transport protein C
MILSDIGHFVEKRHQVTLDEVARHFSAQPDAVRGMLEVWISKGKISKQLTTANCGSSCRQCHAASTEIYIWGVAINPPHAVGNCPKH